MLLQDKSLTQLRGIAQSFGVSDIFQKDDKQLRQAIELKQQSLAPKEFISVPLPAYDARLMTKPPALVSDQKLAEEFLAPFVAKGLKVRYTDEQWFMSFGKKNDEGTLRMPVRQIVRCAEKVMM